MTRFTCPSRAPIPQSYSREPGPAPRPEGKSGGSITGLSTTSCTQGCVFDRAASWITREVMGACSKRSSTCAEMDKLTATSNPLQPRPVARYTRYTFCFALIPFPPFIYLFFEARIHKGHRSQFLYSSHVSAPVPAHLPTAPRHRQKAP